MVIMEAMMHGVIPVSTNVGGISEHVNSENGIVINEKEPQKLIELFIKEIEKLAVNRKYVQQLSDNAFNYALLNFSKERFTESYTKLFTL